MNNWFESYYKKTQEEQAEARLKQLQEDYGHELESGLID